MSQRTVTHSRICFSEYTPAEEIANAITHGIGTLLSIVGLIILIVMAALTGDAWRIVSFSIYGSTLIAAYLASTLYHSMLHPRTKYIFKVLDHCSIYLLIAGTYTPILLLSLHGAWSWILMSVIWGLAVVGITFKAFFVTRFQLISTLAYIGMGWLAVTAWGELSRSLPVGAMRLLIIGGVVYTVGVIFYRWDRLPYNHAIWHGFVMGGSICHFLTMAVYLAS
jgi:hemolysin III